MVRLYAFLVLASLGLSSFAQDTTWVNTLNFQDITKRRGTYIFPDGKQYRKINMHYTLKCDPQTQRDNFNCGEWDYLSYIIVHDTTGAIDSNEFEHSNFQIGDWAPETFEITSIQPTDTFYRYHKFRVVDNVTAADSFTIGIGTGSQSLFDTYRSQYVYTAAELISAGFSAGEITALSLFSSNANGYIQNAEISIGSTNLTQLDAMESKNLTLVYEGNLAMTPGKNRIQFLEPITWDGISNLLVEFSRDNINARGSVEVESETISLLGIQDNGLDQHYTIGEHNFMEIQNSKAVFADIDSAISISLWAKGDYDLPVNTSVIEAKNSAGQRILNIHFPWSNGQVYWDAGNTTGYDRINKVANAADYKDQWNHWVFTKNTRTGSMKIYLNGSLWHSGTAKDRDLSEITQFRIGKGITANRYRGKLDRISLWKSELSATEVTDLNTKDISTGQANFNDLVWSFSFENFARSPYLASDFNNSIEAALRGESKILPYADESFFLTTRSTSRPLMELVMATQTSHLDSTMVYDLKHRHMTFVDRFEDKSDPTKLTTTSIAYQGGHIYSYHPDGSVKDSSAVSSNTVLTREMTKYYIPYEVVDNVEIGRYITPYGIGLDLGPDGFKWIYDVTDYAQYLEGQVTLTAGNQQELIDLRFEMIEGTAPRDLKEISRYITRQSRSYRNIADDAVFTNSEIDVHPDAKTFKLVTRITGHGHNTDNDSKPHCCEWADKTHYLKVDGKDALEWDIWQDDKCALNPVFDQGGNWAPPRAGWCPGAPVDDYNFDITSFVSGSTVSLDYEIEPVPTDNLGQGGGNYVVAMHLMQYGDYNFKNDATVEQIIKPNNWEFYSKLNPTCTQPRIRVRNTGENTITELGLRYGVVGGNPVTYYWKDTLVSDESAEIDLPFAIWDYEVQGTDLKFYAEVFSINKGDDEYAENDRAEADFNIPKVAPKKFTIYFRNNNIEDATLQIFNDAGQVVYEQLDAPAGQLIKEDVNLDPGCYKLVCETENQFGLFYPLIPQVGSGLLRLIGTGTSFSESFNPDFGKSIEYHFTVGYTLSNEDINNYQWSLYPNPSNGIITLETDGTVSGNNYSIEVLSLSGQTVFIQEGKMSGGLMELDLQNQAPGIYFVELMENNTKTTFKVAIH